LGWPEEPERPCLLPTHIHQVSYGCPSPISWVEPLYRKYPPYPPPPHTHTRARAPHKRAWKLPLDFHYSESNRSLSLQDLGGAGYLPPWQFVIIFTWFVKNTRFSKTWYKMSVFNITTTTKWHVIISSGFKVYTCRRPSSASSNHPKCWSWEERVGKNPLWTPHGSVWRWSHFYAHCPVPHAWTNYELVI